jgi:hypothetical protein
MFGLPSVCRHVYAPKLILFIFGVKKSFITHILNFLQIGPTTCVNIVLDIEQVIVYPAIISVIFKVTLLKSIVYEKVHALLISLYRQQFAGSTLISNQINKK